MWQALAQLLSLEQINLNRFRTSILIFFKENMNTPRRENAKAIFTKSKTNYEVQGKSQGRTKLVGLERYQEILKKYILKKKFWEP